MQTTQTQNQKPTRPPWLPPTGDEYHTLAIEQREESERLLSPMYQVLVVEAPDELRRSIGLTIVMLSWAELLHGYELAKFCAGDFDPPTVGPHRNWRGHVRISQAKSQAINVLAKLNQAAERVEQSGKRAEQNPVSPKTANRAEQKAANSENTNRAEQNPLADWETAIPVDQKPFGESENRIPVDQKLPDNGKREVRADQKRSADRCERRRRKKLERKRRKANRR